ncbi:hypothetical protein Q6348_11095 [Isoptericola sp. b441]|uniref:DUF2530 domain-containing protein n=1 Tax=Actinotalea lenta TaxID=3064654 RepID=A0ABT9DET3_9CELL|nr:MULTISPECIES: hypothetical protein [unclassified Isoptericola]MDO8107742.1 hypothetical protein [Isoptericola sp. b441]MDO8120587.1 hypothetical protein [Isoptericola sp. b490]
MSKPEPESPDTRPAPLTTRWWWSAGVMTVIGVAVVAYQWQPIVTSTAVWGNYAVAVLGAGVALYGAWQLWRDWRSERARQRTEDGSSD